MVAANLRRPRKHSGPLLWAALSLAVVGGVVVSTRSGIDVLALLLAGLFLLLIERTVGDWVADTVGPIATILLFTGVAILGMIYITTESGRARAGRLFAAADARGYHTYFFSVREGTWQLGADRAASDIADALTPELRPGTPVTPLAAPAVPSVRRASSPIVSTPAPTAVPAVAVAAAGESGTARTPGPEVEHAASAGAVRIADDARINRVMVVPELGVTGATLTLKALVVAPGEGTLPDVEFTVSGRVVGQATPRPDGIATAEWRTAIPGQYVVSARLTAGSFAGRSASVLLNVMPGRR